MIAFLFAFTTFNFAAGLLAAAKALRMASPAGRERWASRRLYMIALILSATLPAVALAASLAAWAGVVGVGDVAAAPVVLAPIGWLVMFGILFAAVDFAEDGVLGNGLKPR